MPNHETNHIVIAGTEEKVRKVVAEMIKDVPPEDRKEYGPEQHFDFEVVAPMPEILHTVSSPLKVVATQAEADAINVERNKTPWGGSPMIYAMTLADHAKLLAEYGASNWYDWSVANWGTKWNAYDYSPESLVVAETGEHWIAYFVFQTAWSAPHPVFAAIEDKYEVAVHCWTEDEGGFDPQVYGNPYRYLEVTETTMVYPDDGDERPATESEIAAGEGYKRWEVELKDSLFTPQDTPQDTK